MDFYNIHAFSYTPANNEEITEISEDIEEENYTPFKIGSKAHIFDEISSEEEEEKIEKINIFKKNKINKKIKILKNKKK